MMRKMMLMIMRKVMRIIMAMLDVFLGQPFCPSIVRLYVDLSPIIMKMMKMMKLMMVIMTTTARSPKFLSETALSLPKLLSQLLLGLRSNH